MKTIEAIDQYLTYRINLGEKHRITSYVLKAFSNYVGNINVADVTLQQCLDYLGHKGYLNGKITSYWFSIYTALKGLFEWCSQRDLVRQIPLPTLLPRKPESFTPYIYTKEELNEIFQNALHYRKRFNIYYPEVVQHVLKTMYVLGLRPSEVVRLSISDIHLNENYALIRETKFYKSRIVPFNESVSKMFESFLRWRRNKGMTEDEESPLFMTKKGNQVKLSGIQQAFRCICDAANIRRDTTLTRSDVRLQDLRHTFATNRVLEWYKQGKNVQELLPLLSTYLGHEHLDCTAIYISFIPELMTEAGNKFYNFYMNGGSRYE